MRCIELLQASFIFLGEFILKKFRLSGGLTAYLMIFGQGLSLCKSQLFAECLDW